MAKGSGTKDQGSRFKVKKFIKSLHLYPLSFILYPWSFILVPCSLLLYPLSLVLIPFL